MPRRLPVVQNEASEDAEAAQRPPFHWILIGGGLTLTLWAPLVALAIPLGARLAAHAIGKSADELGRGTTTVSPREHTVFVVVAAVPVMLSFIIGSSAAGALVGRFGGRAGPREGALGSVFAVLVVSLVSLRARLGFPVLGIVAGFSVLAALGAIGGGLGALWGRRSRP